MCMDLPERLESPFKQTDDRRYRSLNRCYGKVAVNPRVEWKHTYVYHIVDTHVYDVLNWEFPNQAEQS